MSKPQKVSKFLAFFGRKFTPKTFTSSPIWSHWTHGHAHGAHVLLHIPVYFEKMDRPWPQKYYQLNRYIKVRKA